MRERLLISFGSLTAVAVAVGAVVPSKLQTILAVWAMALLAVGMLELNARSRRLVGPEPRLETLLEVDERERSQPEDLKRLERGLGWIAYEPSYFDFRVRPILRDLICHLALERRGIDLYDDPTAGRGIIEPELLNLVGERKAIEIYGPGTITTSDLTRMVESIEAI